MTDFSIEHWESDTGAKLAVRHKKAKNAKAVIQINHGLAEHSGRYARFAEALAKAGYHSFAHDHRGHGYTSAPDAPQGVFAKSDGLETVIADIRFVNSGIRQQYPDLPVIVFGHSMGGILGTNYAIKHSDTIDGAILWNFNGDGGFLISLLSFLIKIERALKGSDVPSNLASKLTFDDWNKKFKPIRTAFDWLSRDETEVDKYVADPLCGFPASVGLWIELARGIQNIGDDKKLEQIRKDLPINLLGGEADPSTENGKTIIRLHKRMKELGLKDLSYKTLPLTRHETLNELNRDAETSDLIKWLDDRFA